MKAILGIFKLVYVFVLFLLIGAYISEYIRPDIFWPIAFLGLAFPFILLINILFLIFWLLLKNKLFIISLISLIIGYNHIAATFQTGITGDSLTEETKSINFFSYNVEQMGLTAWDDRPEISDSIIKFLNTQSIDILNLQEFRTHATGTHSLWSMRRKIMNSKHYHIAYISQKRKSGPSLITFSKYPIINKGVIRFEHSNNLCIYSDILIDKDTFRVFNCHLESIHLYKKDYSLIDNISDIGDPEERKEIKNLISKIKKAFIKRAGQSEVLAEYIEKSPHKVIVSGDFNDTPVSYTYKMIKEDILKDAFIQSGSGRGVSFPSIFPGLRIDYIFYHKDLHCSNFKTMKTDYSDHRPISCTIGLI